MLLLIPVNQWNIIRFGKQLPVKQFYIINIFNMLICVIFIFTYKNININMIGFMKIQILKIIPIWLTITWNQE